MRNTNKYLFARFFYGLEYIPQESTETKLLITSYKGCVYSRARYLPAKYLERFYLVIVVSSKKSMLLGRMTAVARQE